MERQLLGHRQVPEIGAAVGLAGRAGTIRIDRIRILGELGTADVEVAGRRDRLAVPGQSRRPHTVEQVDPSLDGGQHSFRVTEAHDVTRCRDGQLGQTGVEGGVTLIGRLPHREPTDPEARKSDLYRAPGALGSQLEIDAPLDDAEQRLIRTGVDAAATLGPPQCHLHRPASLFSRRR